MIYTAELFGSPTKRIMDPVHGSIPIFSHEQKIIDDALFQRLRHILQNDVVFLVFPGSKHNRFLHSIGTMHMVSSLFVQITSSYLSSRKSDSITLAQRKSVNYIYCCLRLAALLHDSGHHPFSHQFENSEPIREILNLSLFEKLWANIDYQKFYKNDIQELTHEHFSVRIAYKILTTQNIASTTDIATEDVLSFLETTENDPSVGLIDHCKRFLTIFVPGIEGTMSNITSDKIVTSFLKFLKSLISGELDADKMDYILRDSYFSGCRYGMYNKDHLINSLRLGYEPFFSLTNLHKDKFSNIFDVEFSLAILEKGIGALEDFVYARYQLYLELYNHKTVSGFRKLLSLALTEIISEKDYKAQIEATLSNLDNLTNFTDTFFWEKFREYSKRHPNSACRMLITRDKLKYIGKRVNEDEEQIKTECIRLSHSTKTTVGYWISKIKFSKINERFNTIKILVKENQSLQLKKISTVTNFFDKFDGTDIYHLFEINDFNKSPTVNTLDNKIT